MLAVWKANSRNAKLLEEYLRVLGEEHIADGLPNLTPAPPALPNQTQGAVVAPNSDTSGPPPKPHPAQPAAKKLVKDYSDQHLQAEAVASQPVKNDSRKQK